MYFKFSYNSEVSASEFLEKEMFLLYYMHSELFNIYKTSAKLYCWDKITPRKINITSVAKMGKSKKICTVH